MNFKNLISHKFLAPKFKRTRAIIEPMIKMLKEEGENLKILDAGCGDGSVDEELIKLGYEVFGIDKNKEALEKAKEKGVKTVFADLEKEIPFPENSFDVIWCLRTIEHIFYTEKFLRECFRVLKPRGVLLITAENIASLVNRVRLLLGKYPLRVAPSENFPWENADHPRYVDHVRCFTKEMLKEVLKRTGFKIEKITSDFVCFNFGEYNFPPWSEFLGKIFHSLGETLIFKARKL